MFMDAIDQAHFMTCTFFCFLYVAINFLLQRYHEQGVKGGINDNKLFRINMYGLLMSTPFMPFFYRGLAGDHYPVTILTIFMFSNFIWQLIGVKFYLKANPAKSITVFSITNVLAWIVVSFANYEYYSCLIAYFTR